MELAIVCKVMIDHPSFSNARLRLVINPNPSIKRIFNPFTKISVLYMAEIDPNASTDVTDHNHGSENDLNAKYVVDFKLRLVWKDQHHQAL